MLLFDKRKSLKYNYLLDKKDNSDSATTTTSPPVDDVEAIREIIEAKLLLDEPPVPPSQIEEKTPLCGSEPPPPEPHSDYPKKRVLKTVDMQGLIEHWRSGGFKKIVTMVGAGISTCKFRCVRPKPCFTIVCCYLQLVAFLTFGHPAPVCTTTS